ncbi:Adenine nucleotide alpha hydrolase-like superfamily protein [Abeliophyllum distichum]|uniref:Adenine nucleotide alpha hydrolase-like superfamily protein n=1 Tax=Abeliophyllum distichum TaxID=126358 RepID=A0ABD1VZV4_9LAMI
MPKFCLNRIRPLVRVRSPPVHSKNHANFTSSNTDHEKKKENSGDVMKAGVMIGRKIMIVVDSSLESKNALQWALTHTVQSQDMVILLYVTKPSKQGGECNKGTNPRVSEFLSSMKKLCQLRRPEVHIEVAVAEDKEKGPAIVEEAKKRGVAMLILGQKKRSTAWRLIMMWAGNRIAAAGGVEEYCIQNAGCMAIAVRRKSKKVGGYLITTKRQKDFWLLA